MCDWKIVESYVFAYISKSAPRKNICAIFKMGLYHRKIDWAMQKWDGSLLDERLTVDSSDFFPKG